MDFSRPVDRIDIGAELTQCVLKGRKRIGSKKKNNNNKKKIGKLHLQSS